ncbi:MAG: DUF6569 family protein [Acidobacteriota bacterium]
MKINRILIVAALLLLVGGIGVAKLIKAHREQALPEKEQVMQVGDYRIVGPYVHENLAVFLVQGEDKIKGRNFLTLQEALEQQKVVVHETSDVNELTIENVSEDEVYIQSGDIVKGGKQDRVLAYDLILSPKSGQLPLAAYCVERGRWRSRGQESATKFDSANEHLSSKELKLAAKRSKQQGEVWEQVAEAQKKLTKNLGVSVESDKSATSLPLTLENEKLQQATEDYIKALSTIIDGKADVIGFAFAINGKINNTDIYASSALFRKLWPKLLKASAVEAIAELQTGKQNPVVTVDDLKSCLADVEKGTKTEQSVAGRTKVISQETEKNISFETRDQSKGDTWVHRNYIRK